MPLFLVAMSVQKKQSSELHLYCHGYHCHSCHHYHKHVHHLLCHYLLSLLCCLCYHIVRAVFSFVSFSCCDHPSIIGWAKYHLHIMPLLTWTKLIQNLEELFNLHRIETWDNYKQLLDEVFVISRIIKVEAGVISRSRRLRLITLTETLIILNITKTESNNCIIIHSTKQT